MNDQQGSTNVPAAGVRLLQEKEVCDLITRADALEAVREAFARMGRDETMVPPAMIIYVPESEGEVHVKAAHLHHAEHYAVKFASIFPRNPARGLAAVSGMILVFSAKTGFLSGMLLDNGFLTDLRTGAAGALAADLLAKREIAQVAIIGAGIQGRYQLEALLGVRRPAGVRICDTDRQAAETYALEMAQRTGLPVTVAPSVREAVDGADVIVSTTPAQKPHLMADWVAPGAHITAMGSDNPMKNELEPALLARADKLVVDSMEMCALNGELHHALSQGLLTRDGVFAELGEIAAGLKPGRTADDEITVADLTGLGIQDTAVANYVMRQAATQGVGRSLDSL
ncbi:MAG: ornithine cyclodeaminase family protein [Thermoleophilia bacterium]|jgi:ornithine cyclodeaminase|nr:ornithine cyclodeaminase family protein [Thermoleophilia bacterium]